MGKILLGAALLGIALAAKADDLPIFQASYAKPSAQFSPSGASILASVTSGKLTIFAGANEPLGDDQPEYPLQNKEAFLGVATKDLAVAVKGGRDADSLSISYGKKATSVLNIERSDAKMRGYASVAIPISRFTLSAIGGSRSTPELERKTLEFITPQNASSLLGVTTFYDFPLDTRSPSTFVGAGLGYDSASTHISATLRNGTQDADKMQEALLHIDHHGTLDTTLDAQVRKLSFIDAAYETRFHWESTLHVGRGSIGIAAYEQSYGGKIVSTATAAGAGAQLLVPIGNHALRASAIHEQDTARSESTSRVMLSYVAPLFVTIGIQRNATATRSIAAQQKISPLGAIGFEMKNTSVSIEAGNRPAIRAYEKGGMYANVTMTIKR